MKIKLLTAIAFLLLGCASGEKTKETKTEEMKTDSVTAEITQDPMMMPDTLRKFKASVYSKRLEFDQVENLFKFSKVRHIDSTNAFEKEKFTKLSAEEYYEAFQDTVEYYYGEGSGIYAYYYSDQGEWKGFTRYIFVVVDETCCINYYYNIYDQQGQKIDSFVIDAGGGEGGWGIDTEFFITNDSTINQTIVECEHGVDGVICDSSLAIYHLLSTGKALKEDKSKHAVKRKN